MSQGNGEQKAGRRFFFGVVAVFLSIVFTLVAVEAGLRLFSKSFQKYVPQYLIIDTKGELFFKSGDPALLYEMYPNKSTFTLGKETQTNSRGFRDKEYEIPKPDGVYRIAGIGDSIAFGLDLPLAQTYQKQIEGILDEKVSGERVEVVNMAVPGYNMVQYFAGLVGKGMEYEPDCVVVSYFADDFFQPKVPKKWEYRRQLLEVHSHIYKLIHERLRVLGNKTSEGGGDHFFSNEAALEEGKRTLRNMWSYLDERGIGLYVIIHPILEQQYVPRKIHFSNYVKDALEGTGTPVLDLFPLYMNTGTAIENYRINPADFTHPGAEANRLIAQWVVEDWEKKGLFVFKRVEELKKENGGIAGKESETAVMDMQ